jgi:hypothetical protein
VHDDPLATLFSALFSHSTKPNASVAMVLAADSPNLDLQPRMTRVATSELVNLLALVGPIPLNSQSQDRRVCRFSDKSLTISLAYKNVFRSRLDFPLAGVIWKKNYAPNKCRLFLWLTTRQRLQTNERRFRKGLSNNDNCPFCQQPETSLHMLLKCPSVQVL